MNRSLLRGLGCAVLVVASVECALADVTPMPAGAGTSSTSAPSTSASSTSASSTSTRQTPERYQVVVQVSDDDPAKWTLALNNVKNVQAMLGAASVDIEIVAYGPGIGMLLQESVAGPGVKQAIAGGVRVAACENTMKSRGLIKDDMLPQLLYVPAGVVELMKRQHEGYAYIRP